MSDTTFDKQKILDMIFDPHISEILELLQNEPKSCVYLSNLLGISEAEIQKRLQYLIDHKFIEKSVLTNGIILEVDGDKLAAIIEDNDNFKHIDDGMAELDSFLN